MPREFRPIRYGVASGCPRQDVFDAVHALMLFGLGGLGPLLTKLTAGVVNGPIRSKLNSELGAAVAKAKGKLPPGAAGQCHAMPPEPTSSCAYDPSDVLQQQLHAAELRVPDQHLALPGLGLRLDLTHLSCHAVELCAVNTSTVPLVGTGLGGGVAVADAPSCAFRSPKCGSATCPPATPWFSPVSKACHASADWKDYYECCIAGGATPAPTTPAASTSIGLQLEGLGVECSMKWAIASTGAPAPPQCVRSPLR